MKTQKCISFFIKGSCRYGNRCFYSHAIPKVPLISTITASSSITSKISRSDTAIPLAPVIVAPKDVPSKDSVPKTAITEAPVEVDWFGAISKLAAMPSSFPEKNKPRTIIGVQEVEGEKKMMKFDIDRGMESDDSDAMKIDEPDLEIEELD